MTPKKVFLYAEVQNSRPFGEVDWRKTNAILKTIPGLLRKTWLSGIKTNSTGGLYEFDSVENALAFAHGPFIDMVKQSGSALSIKIFDGDVVEEASRDMNSPHYA